MLKRERPHGTWGAAGSSGNPTAGPGLGGLSQLVASTCKVIRKLFEAASPKILGTENPLAPLPGVRCSSVLLVLWFV